ncbi:MAG: DNA-3-methyladenine glycosylase [Dokdonella sp.]
MKSPKTLIADDDQRLDLKPLPRSFYERDPRLVAPELLYKILLRGDGRAGRIIEVEAYCGEEDPAAHTFNGPTPRNRTMFGPGGHMYVYFTYGMHWCANTVCGLEGQGWGVLIRAVTPIAGIERMRPLRPRARSDRDLASGPARLTQAFGIDGSFDGADLVRNDRGVSVMSDGTMPPTTPRAGPRIGISRGKEFPWRWRCPL